MRDRRKSEGELLLLLAALCLLVPPMVFVLNGENEARFETLKDRGLVSLGRVTGKAVVTEDAPSSRHGRPRTRTLHQVELAYDLNATAPYRQWKATGTVPPALAPAPTRGTVKVNRFAYGGYEVGQERMLVFAWGDPGGPMLVDQLEFQGSWQSRLLWGAGLTAIMLGGLALGRRGWRLRFSAE